MVLPLSSATVLDTKCTKDLRDMLGIGSKKKGSEVADGKAVGKVGVGLINLGATCYVNSLLQVCGATARCCDQKHFVRLPARPGNRALPRRVGCDVDTLAASIGACAKCGVL